MTVGTGSNYQHYLKLKKLKESGQLLESFKETLNDLEETYKYFDYIPPPPLSYVWKQFWSARRTKPFEYPLTHADFYYISELNKIEWDMWEIDLLLKWDREYYYYADKHKEQK